MNLGWGEAVCIRKAFLETSNKQILFDIKTLENLGYADHFGDPALVALTRKVIKRQIGKEYDHILITNGATGGVTIALRSFSGWLPSCITRDPPYFRLFPDMIRAAGMFQVHENSDTYKEHYKSSVYLVDSLTNPFGTFSEKKYNYVCSPIVWDATYYGNVYAPGNHPQPDHDILVGSYSKLTGLNGVRLGWIATNDSLRYERMKRLVDGEYCSLSAASIKIVMDTAGQFTERDWSLFEKKAQNKLDDNRTEFSKLEKFFGGTPVPKYGMFYYAEMDSTCKKLFEKSGIVWSPGSDLGTNDDFGRFNIGQDVKSVKEAVSTVLKNDKRY